MLKMIYLDLADSKYHIMTLPDGKPEPLTREGEDKTTFLGLCNGGQCAYYSKVRYTLREDMARRLQYRFFRYDMKIGTSHELFTRWDRSGFQIMTFIPMKDGRFFLLAARDYTTNQGYFADAEGAHPQLLWETTGYPYGFAPSPDGKAFACHMALEEPQFNPPGNIYSINLMLPDGTRRYVCGEAGRLMFGPTWSPDGRYLAFQSCTPAEDPAHHFAAVCICRPDGSGFRRLTGDRGHYFGTSAGLENYRTGGSNWLRWTQEGQLIYSKLLPGSHPDAHFDATQENHEELVYDPAMGRGGCGLTLLDPETGAETEITPAVEGQWDFRASLSRDGSLMLFTRVRFSEAPEILLTNRATGEIRVVARGTDGVGADYPSFLELPD